MLACSAVTVKKKFISDSSLVSFLPALPNGASPKAKLSVGTRELIPSLSPVPLKLNAILLP